MTRVKTDRNKTIALMYYARGMSIRQIAKQYRRDPSTIQRLVARYRTGLSPEHLKNAEGNRKLTIMQKKYGKKRRVR